MRVNDVRNMMVLGVHTNKNLLSRIIRWFTGAYYQHSGTIVVINNKIWVFEAVEQGAVLTPFDDYIIGIEAGKYEVAFFEPDMTVLTIYADTEEKWLNFVKRYVDKTPYDFENLIIDQPIRILTGEWIGKTGEEAKKRMICNELSYTHLQETFPEVENIDYKANWLDILKWVIQSSNNININNINEFLKK